MPLFLRTLEVETGKRFTVAAATVFLLGFLPLPFGSIATFFLGAMTLVAVVQAARRQTPLKFPMAARFAVTASLAYVAVDVVGLVFHANPAGAWVPLVGSLHFLFFPFLLAALGQARGFDPLALFVRGVRFGAIVSVVFAVIEVADGLDRAVGGMINPIPFGSTAALFAFLSLIGMADEGWRGRVFALLAFAAGLGSTLLSEARGAWLALPVLGIILLVYLYVRHGKRIAAGAGLAMAAAAALVMFAAGDSLRERMEETFVMFEGFEFGQAADDNHDAFSLDQRALLMVYGLEAFGDRPVFGYGPQNAVAEVQARAAADGYVIERYGHLHNELLTEAVGNGTVGLIILVALLAAPVVTARRSPRDKKFADRMAFAALLTAGTTLFGLTSLAFGHDITNSVYVSALLALCLGAGASEREAVARP